MLQCKTKLLMRYSIVELKNNRKDIIILRLIKKTSEKSAIQQEIFFVNKNPRSFVPGKISLRGCFGFLFGNVKSFSELCRSLSVRLAKSVLSYMFAIYLVDNHKGMKYISANQLIYNVFN